MLERILLGFLICLFTQYTFGQAADNIKINNTDEQLIITYDLIGKSDGVYTVTLSIELEDGEVVIPKSINGDVGLVATGYDKKIVWDVYEDVNSLSGSIKANIEVSSFKNDEQIQATPKPPAQDKSVIDVPYNDLKQKRNTFIYGTKIGLGNSTVDANISQSSYEKKFSFDGGLYARVNVHRRVFIQPEVLYNLHAFQQILTDSSSVKTNLHYLKGQLMAGVSPIGLGLFFNAGLYFNYLFAGNEVEELLGDKIKTSVFDFPLRNDSQLPYAKQDFGYTLGGSLNFARGAFALGVLYSNSFTNHVDRFYWAGSGINENLKRYNRNFRFFIQKSF